MHLLIYLLAAATPEPNELAPPEKDTRAPSPEYRCVDGSVAPSRGMCPEAIHPDEMHPAPPPVFSYPRTPTRSRPAKPRNNPGSWATINDYPSRALNQLREGTVGFRLFVGVDGFVTDCQITMASGWADLDMATCNNAKRRARFDPALDESGEPVNGTYSNRVTWRIPMDPSSIRQIQIEPNSARAVFGTSKALPDEDYPSQALQMREWGAAVIFLNISAAGKATACAIEDSSGSEVLDARSCELALDWSFVPAQDAKGKNVAGMVAYRFEWVIPPSWRKAAADLD